MLFLFIKHCLTQGEKESFISKLLNIKTEKYVDFATDHVPNTVRSNKLNHESLEQRKVYCRAKQGEQVAPAQKP